MGPRPFVLGVLSFAFTFSGGAAPPPPPATVPVPRVALASVPAPPAWVAERDLKLTVSVGYAIDLDLLAPLGNGRGNAAVYLREFAPDGVRAKTIESAIQPVRSPQEAGTWMVLPPGHVLLLEAEPWIDQATCSFYPEIWRQKGIDTPLFSVFHATVLGRSWIARGNAAKDVTAAMADYRRAVRLGRLLLQDDVWMGQDRAGRNLIALGARAMYERAKAAGDPGTAAAALVVLAEHAWVYAVDTARLGRIDVMSTLEDPGILSFVFGPAATVDDGRFHAIAEMAKSAANRRYRMEAMVRLFILKHMRAGDADERAGEALTALEQDRDPLVAEAAVYYRGAKKPEIHQAAVIK